MRRSAIAFIPLASLLLVGLSACDPDYETTGHIRVVGNSAAERSYLAPDAENVGAGSARLAGIAGDVAEVWYALGEERSTYLFDGNLAAGVEGGGYLQMPAYGDGSEIVEDGGVQWQVVGADRPDYQSFRVYDSGSCSFTLDWETPLIPGVIPAFAPTVVSAVDEQLARCSSAASQRFSRVGNALLEPVYRARAGGGAGALGTDDDVIRFTARYNAESVGGCAPLNLDVSFEFGFRLDAEGGVIGFLDEQSVYAEVVDFCIAEGTIEDMVQTELRDRIVPALEAALTNRTRINPTSIGLPAGPSCSTDADCVTAFPGTGHTCSTANTCELQLNIDRVNVRPEGVELIVTETDDDVQRVLFDSSTFAGALVEGLACGLDRGNGLLLPDGATPGTLSSINVPVGAGAAVICAAP